MSLVELESQIEKLPAEDLAHIEELVQRLKRKKSNLPTIEEALQHLDESLAPLHDSIEPSSFGPDPVAYIRALRDEDIKR
jgi:hypothetical protein